MKLEKLPSIIRNNQFNEKGLVETVSGLLVPVYVGSALGFNEPGKYYLNNIFYPKLKEINVLPLCPFAACEEYLDLSKLDDNMTVKEQREFWNEFNQLIGTVNYETLMPKSKFMIALLEGHGIDDGLSAEIASFALNHGPVIGIRSDFRLAENPAAPINPAVIYFIDQGHYNGWFFDGPNAYENSFKYIEPLVSKILNK